MQSASMQKRKVAQAVAALVFALGTQHALGAAFALQEQSVSGQISNVFSLAREEQDYLSEQFMQWFLKEQVEEEATMSDLLEVAERVRDDPMTLEEYIAREVPGGEAADPTAPPAAGGVTSLA